MSIKYCQIKTRNGKEGCDHSAATFWQRISDWKMLWNVIKPRSKREEQWHAFTGYGNENLKHLNQV